MVNSNKDNMLGAINCGQGYEFSGVKFLFEILHSWIGVHVPPRKDTTFTKMFVGGLSFHTTDVTLGQHFSQYGEIDHVAVIIDKQTNKSKGY